MLALISEGSALLMISVLGSHVAFMQIYGLTDVELIYD